MFLNFCSYCCQEPLRERQLDDLASNIQITILDTIPQLVKQSKYDSLLQTCQKWETPFTDQEFPPDHKALGDFIQLKRKFSWKRMSQLVPNPCIYNPNKHPADSVIAVTSNGSHMKAALLALAFQPRKIHSIFGEQREVSPYGIYRLRVKIKGQLQWIVIDDYVPVFQDTDRPLLCGTVGQQLWIMLIFKAFAKVLGSYSAIQGQDCYSVLNTFSPGPCFSYLLHPSLHEDKQIFDEIKKGVNNLTNSICFTTSKKPRFGLLPDHNYAVRSCENGSIELVGLERSQQLSHRFHLADLIQDCTEMAVSIEDSRFVNSAPTHLQLLEHQPKFITFRLEEPYTATFNFWVNKTEDSFLRVVVARQEEQNSYTHVASKLEVYYSEMALECADMMPGTYVILLMVSGQSGTPRPFNMEIVCHRKLQGQFTDIKLEDYHCLEPRYVPFMKGVLTDLARKVHRQTVRELPTSGSVLQINQLFRRGGLGYVTINAGTKRALKYLRIRISRRDIEQSNYQLLDPTADEMKVFPQQQLTLVFLLRFLPKEGAQTLQFPPGISVMEIF